jgi:hypothetical protein
MVTVFISVPILSDTKSRYNSQITQIICFFTFVDIISSRSTVWKHNIRPCKKRLAVGLPQTYGFLSSPNSDNI